MAGFGGMAGLSIPAAAAAAVQPTPFDTGHVIRVAGKLSQPPTTAQCEADYGTACYQAFQLQRAYNLAPLFSKGIEGQGETIVIVDAFGSPSIASDLQTFDSAMGLPNPPSFRVITPEGKITTNPTNCTSSYSPYPAPDLCSDYYGWTDETSLDVEWSHVMAPKANILLVETPASETEGIYQRLLQRRDRVGHRERCLVRSGPGPLRAIGRAEPGRDRSAEGEGGRVPPSPIFRACRDAPHATQRAMPRSADAVSRDGGVGLARLRRRRRQPGPGRGSPASSRCCRRRS
jgi:hypothetical protein